METNHKPRFTIHDSPRPTNLLGLPAVRIVYSYASGILTVCPSSRPPAALALWALRKSLNATRCTLYAISEIRFTLHEIRKSSKFVESIRQFELFLQNKPNFPKNRAFISYGKTKDYKNAPPFLAQKSQSQF
jgi:hypothetical protein